jgi:hypothetical protein
MARYRIDELKSGDLSQLIGFARQDRIFARRAWKDEFASGE